MNFKLEKQLLFINDINLTDESIEVSTNLFIWPMDKFLKQIKLNCNGPFIRNVYFTDINEKIFYSEFSCEDKFLTINIPVSLQKSVVYNSVYHHVDKSEIICIVPHLTMKVVHFSPCFEWDNVCSWCVDIKVPKANMIAICCDSIEYIQDNVFSFALTKPSTARNISFVAGKFDVFELRKIIPTLLESIRRYLLNPLDTKS